MSFQLRSSEFLVLLWLYKKVMTIHMCYQTARKRWLVIMQIKALVYRHLKRQLFPLCTTAPTCGLFQNSCATNSELYVTGMRLVRPPSVNNSTHFVLYLNIHTPCTVTDIRLNRPPSLNNTTHFVLYLNIHVPRTVTDMRLNRPPSVNNTFCPISKYSCATYCHGHEVGYTTQSQQYHTFCPVSKYSRATYCNRHEVEQTTQCQQHILSHI